MRLSVVSVHTISDDRPDTADSVPYLKVTTEVRTHHHPSQSFELRAVVDLMTGFHSIMATPPAYNIIQVSNEDDLSDLSDLPAVVSWDRPILEMTRNQKLLLDNIRSVIDIGTSNDAGINTILVLMKEDG